MEAWKKLIGGGFAGMDAPSLFIPTIKNVQCT